MCAFIVWKQQIGGDRVEHVERFIWSDQNKLNIRGGAQVELFGDRVREAGDMD